MAPPPDRSDPPEAKGVLGTVRNATLLLGLLASGAPVQSVTDLAKRGGLSIATTHRVLRSLAQAGLVRQSRPSQGYGLGPGLVLLADRYLADLPVLGALAPYLVELRDLTKSTIEVYVLIEGDAVAVDRVEGPHAPGVFRTAGRGRADRQSAAGRVLLAGADPGEGKAVPADRDATAYLAERVEDHGELHVAVPVRSRGGAVVAALAATAPLPPEEESDALAVEVARHLIRAAAAVAASIPDE